MERLGKGIHGGGGSSGNDSVLTGNIGGREVLRAHWNCCMCKI